MLNTINWLPTTTPPTLTVKAIHIWRIILNRPNYSADFTNQLKNNYLAADEIHRAERFIFPEHQQRFILARTGLRKILATYANLPAAELKFNYAHHGKPALDNFSQLEFNLSHSHEIALLAVTTQTPVGIDVEQLREDRDHMGLAERFFSAAEFAELQSLPASQQLTAFYELWTCKEAFIKALGMGLSYPLDEFTIQLGLNRQPVLLTPEQREDQAWSVQTFIPNQGYTSALAIQRRDNELRFFDLEL